MAAWKYSSMEQQSFLKPGIPGFFILTGKFTIPAEIDSHEEGGVIYGFG